MESHNCPVMDKLAIISKSERPKENDSIVDISAKIHYVVSMHRRSLAFFRENRPRIVSKQGPSVLLHVYACTFYVFISPMWETGCTGANLPQRWLWWLNIYIELNGTNTFRWALEKSGNFTTASLYRESKFPGMHNKWMMEIWMAKIPLKIKIFMCGKYAMTKFNLQIKRNWLGEVDCKMCGSLESTDHITSMSAP